MGTVCRSRAPSWATERFNGWRSISRRQIDVDRSIDFITRHEDEPFYLHLWLNDVHDPFHPSDEQFARFADHKANPYLQQFWPCSTRWTARSAGCRR